MAGTRCTSRGPSATWAALVAGTGWPLLLLRAVLVVTQVVLLREERSLERRFGAAYRSYKASVRRYL